MKLTLYPWQEEDAEWMMEGNRLLANDCGTGKTLITVESVKRSAKGPVLVVAPRLTKEWWVQTIQEQGGGYAKACESAGRGIPWDKLATYQGSKLAWVIVHPTAVRMNYREMMRVPWDTIVVDEAHRFKNRKAKQTKALWKIPARHKLLLTATPWGKSPADLWALLRYMYPKQYTSYWRFRGKYVDEYSPPDRRWSKIKGPKNLRQLSKELAPIYRKRKKEDVLDLPELIKTDIPVVLEKKQASLYTELAREAYAQLQGQEIILENALVKFLRLQQCALDPALMADLSFMPTGAVPIKIQWLEEWLEDNPDEPVVITSRYRKFVEKWLRDLAPKACIVGGMSERDVGKAVRYFNKHGVLVGSLDAIKEGLNLQRASTMIITDGTYSSTAEYQLSQRIHRVGQKSDHCQVIHLVGKLPNGKWTVDKLVRDAIEHKFSQAELLDRFVRSFQK